MSATGRNLSIHSGSIAFTPCGTQFAIEATGTEELVAFEAGLPRHARGAP
jgi:mannose-6-phosphate isomerase-like protein (cupin superfamily)